MAARYQVVTYRWDEPNGKRKFLRGDELETREWGGLALAPKNAEAVAIQNYWFRNEHATVRPPRPYDADGVLFLPAQINGVYDEAWSAGGRRDWPRYRATKPQMLGKLCNIAAGATFTWRGWPLEGSEPVNAPARAVVDFCAVTRARGPSPWCEFRDALIPKVAAFLDEDVVRSSAA